MNSLKFNFGVVLASGILFLAPCLLSVRAQAAACEVTIPGGGFSNNGNTTLLDRLTDPNCTRITFAVDHLDPLNSLVELRGGVTLSGRAGIVLRYDPDYHWPDQGFRSCLLRILPLNNATAAVTVSNLTIQNPYGKGICVLDRNNTRVNESVFSNLTVRAGTWGIDLGNSQGNTLENVRVLGDESAGGNTAVGINVGVSGSARKISGGQVEGFDNGIVFANGGLLSQVTQVNFRAISGLPILNPPSRNAVPSDIRPAFVTQAQFTLTGLAYDNPAQEENALALEVYKVTVGAAAGTLNYEYKFSISSSDLVANAPQDVRTSLVDRKRFLHTVVIDGNTFTANDPIAILSQQGLFTTEMVLAQLRAADQIIGHPRCANPESAWYWWSYDAAANLSNDLRMKGWDFDLDGDGIKNSCLNDPCADSKLAEDLDRNCRVDALESTPDNFFSQFDFDCDRVPDHPVAGRVADNCPLHPAAVFLDGNGVPYTKERRLAIACRDPNTQAGDTANRNNFKDYNPSQSDLDGDGTGDACETDEDGDGFNRGEDNCPTIFNPDQRDSDGDSAGDACQQIVWIGGAAPVATPPDDADFDGIKNLNDNCPFIMNADQRDTDRDRVGDKCDFDRDNDGLMNEEEDFNANGTFDRGELNPLVPDTDNDGICDGPAWGYETASCIRPRDNCPLAPNRDQIDRDEDGIGDACDNNEDSDGDGVPDPSPNFDSRGGDNCPTIPNNYFYHTRMGGTLILPQSDYTERNGVSDGVGDPCDSDDDNDGLDDATESGMADWWLKRSNSDHYNHWDADMDDDNWRDGIDICPNLDTLRRPAALGGDISNRDENTDFYDRAAFPGPASSRCGRYPLTDLDGDGIPNDRDNCDFIPNRWQRNLDGDLEGDACDLDDDNDDNLRTDPNVDECKAQVRAGVQKCFSSPNRGIPRFCIGVTLARNGFACRRNVAAGIFGEPVNCTHTCDFDESGNFRLQPWDPNSDRKDGNIFDKADEKCDGAGIGFGRSGSTTTCVVSDPCPEFFNPAGEEGSCGPNLISPAISAEDLDGDGVANEDDNCVQVPNVEQTDIDSDKSGDFCDADMDGDLILNESDNCPLFANRSQVDTDADQVGDGCDPDPFANVASKVQGGGLGGCQFNGKSSSNNDLLFLIPAMAFVLALLRRRKISL